VKKVKVNGGER